MLAAKLAFSLFAEFFYVGLLWFCASRFPTRYFGLTAFPSLFIVCCFTIIYICMKAIGAIS